MKREAAPFLLLLIFVTQLFIASPPTRAMQTERTRQTYTRRKPNKPIKTPNRCRSRCDRRRKLCLQSATKPWETRKCNQRYFRCNLRCGKN